jgi:hypothetical protein
VGFADGGFFFGFLVGDGRGRFYSKRL